jgi:hypothetical protein
MWQALEDTEMPPPLILPEVPRQHWLTGTHAIRTREEAKRAFNVTTKTPGWEEFMQKTRQKHPSRLMSSRDRTDQVESMTLNAYANDFQAIVRNIELNVVDPSLACALILQFDAFREKAELEDKVHVFEHKQRCHQLKKDYTVGLLLVLIKENIQIPDGTALVLLAALDGDKQTVRGVFEEHFRVGTQDTDVDHENWLSDFLDALVCKMRGGDIQDAARLILEHL